MILRAEDGSNLGVQLDHVPHPPPHNNSLNVLPEKRQCLNIGLYYVELYDCHCQFPIELTLSNMAFYCDPITTRPLPRFSCCHQRTVVRWSSINLLLLCKHIVTYICSQLVYILKYIWQLMYINRHRYELSFRKVIINLVIRVCAITNGNPSVGSYGHVIV